MAGYAVLTHGEWSLPVGRDYQLSGFGQIFNFVPQRH